MKADYSHFSTTQRGPHYNLSSLVNRHLTTKYLRPIPHHQLISFAQINEFIAHTSRPVIIDSGCGVGLSSIKLAEQFYDHTVIGIDKSKDRLSRAPKTPPNCLLIQGDVIDLWRLIENASWSVARHYLLYPNPWPKACQVQRRFHAHPIWPTLVKLAPYFELRCNWRIYAEEAMIALQMLGQHPELSIKSDTEYLTMFEKKYLESGCEIYIIKNTLI